jgi:hypothetical protein
VANPKSDWIDWPPDPPMRRPAATGMANGAKQRSKNEHHEYKRSPKSQQERACVSYGFSLGMS